MFKRFPNFFEPRALNLVKILLEKKQKRPYQYLTLYRVNMTYNLKKSIIQWESVCICICLRPRRGSFSAQCVVLVQQYFIDFVQNNFVQYSNKPYLYSVKVILGYFFVKT